MSEAHYVERPESLRDEPEAQSKEHAPQWTFLSNHAHVLVCLDRRADMRMRDIAERVGITERGVQRILSELEQAKVIVRHRHGRRNRYELAYSAPLRHPLEAHITVEQFLAALSLPSDNGKK